MGVVHVFKFTVIFVLYAERMEIVAAKIRKHEKNLAVLYLGIEYLVMVLFFESFVTGDKLLYLIMLVLFAEIPVFERTVIIGMFGSNECFAAIIIDFYGSYRRCGYYRRIVDLRVSRDYPEGVKNRCHA